MTNTTKAHDTAMVTQAALSAWAERRPERTESERAEIARAFSAHLPDVDPITISVEDEAAMRAAFIRRFDEDLPRTETLMAVAHIGRRIEARHRIATEDARRAETERLHEQIAFMTIEIALLRKKMRATTDATGEGE